MGLAACLGVDHRQALRWRKKGAVPNGGAMLALVDLAVPAPEGLGELLGRDLLVVRWGRD